MQNFTLNLALTSLITLSSLGAVDCPIQNSKLVTEVNYDDKDPSSLDCSYVEEAIGMIEHVGTYFNDAPAVNLILLNKGDTAVFDMGHSIKMSQEFTLGEPTTREQNLNILAHEYGHAILKERLYRDVRRLKYFFKKMQFYSRTSLQLMKDIDNLNDPSKTKAYIRKRDSYIRD